MSVEPNQSTVVKDSIIEINTKITEDLSITVPFTASGHAYSWVIRSEKTPELIDWLSDNGFQNIQTDSTEETANPDTTVTATSDGGIRRNTQGCTGSFIPNCNSVGSCSSYYTNNPSVYGTYVPCISTGASGGCKASTVPC